MYGTLERVNGQARLRFTRRLDHPPEAVWRALTEAEDLAAWREHTRGDFRLRLLPGGHFFFHSSRAMLLQAVSDELTARPWPRDVQSSSSPRPVRR